MHLPCKLHRGLTHKLSEWKIPDLKQTHLLPAEMTLAIISGQGHRYHVDHAWVSEFPIKFGGIYVSLLILKMLTQILWKP